MANAFFTQIITSACKYLWTTNFSDDAYISTLWIILALT